MDKVDYALQHAKFFRVFPIIPNSKLPAISDYKVFATQDPDQIRDLWKNGHHDCNIGLLRDDYLMLDIDKKKGRNGYEWIETMRLLGRNFPKTFAQTTPTGGGHLAYITSRRFRNSTGGIAVGVDVPTYIVGGGSTIDGRPYLSRSHSPVNSPSWMYDEIDYRIASPKFTSVLNDEIDVEYAAAWFVKFLAERPGAVRGERDNTVYKLACIARDKGVVRDTAVDLICDWAGKCHPPLPENEVHAPVQHAYTYAKNSPGASAPDAQFEEREVVVISPPQPPQAKTDPVEELNKKYAFVMIGGSHRILQETTGKNIVLMNEDTFHAKFANKFVHPGDSKPLSVSRLWMKSNYRRAFEGLVFEPAKDAFPGGHYNLWRGFAVEPRSLVQSNNNNKAQDAVKAFKEHLCLNICGGDTALTHWVTAWFANIIQEPGRKPGVALVLRGKKGVGKNMLVDRFGHLLGRHYFVASNRRYLAGNFNGYLENKLFVTYDEACWAGDKPTEGILKGLITGDKHTIEKKGQEVFEVSNHTRVAILGNDDWLVPATGDERRYVVLDVGEGRKQDIAFFDGMREGLEAGGYELLLHYFMNYDYKDVQLRLAPTTAGLLQQKLTSLDAFNDWWLQCLREGVVFSDLENKWPTQISCQEFRDQIIKYTRGSGRAPSSVQIGLRARSIGLEHFRKREGDDLRYLYKVPPIDEARLLFEKMMGQSVDW